MAGKNFSDRIFVGITGKRPGDLKKKIKEINKLGITKAALFLEFLGSKQKEKIYDALRHSCIKEIPLVHIRHDMAKDELVFLSERFKTRYFNIHEGSFRILQKWKGFYSHLFLEMDTNNFVPSFVNVNKIGGFCVDLAHFKVDEEKWSKEFEYISKREDVDRYFVCNHLSGYSFKKNKDLHKVKSIKDFEYLNTLPKFLFGEVIAIEVMNSIKEQLELKKHIAKLLNERFNRQS